MCGGGAQAFTNASNGFEQFSLPEAFLIPPKLIVAYLSVVVKGPPVKVQAQRLGLATRFFANKSLVIDVVARKHTDGGHWADFHYENLRYVVGNAVFGEIE